MTTFFVKPAHADLLVRNPDNSYQPLAAAGETVPANEYWRRRLKDGDVVQAKPDKAPKADPKK